MGSPEPRALPCQSRVRWPGLRHASFMDAPDLKGMPRGFAVRAAPASRPRVAYDSCPARGDAT